MLLLVSIVYSLVCLCFRWFVHLCCGCLLRILVCIVVLVMGLQRVMVLDFISILVGLRFFGVVVLLFLLCWYDWFRFSLVAFHFGFDFYFGLVICLFY